MTDGHDHQLADPPVERPCLSKRFLNFFDEPLCARPRHDESFAQKNVAFTPHAHLRVRNPIQPAEKIADPFRQVFPV